MSAFIVLLATVPSLLTILFAALKLAKIISWSWWLVASPILFVMFGIFCFFCYLYHIVPEIMADDEEEGQEDMPL